MSQEPPTVHRGTHRFSIDAEAIADDLIANAAVDTPAERGATEPQALVNEAVNDCISGHRIDAWDWFEATYLIEWLTAEYDLHPTALTAHVVEDASSPAFGSIIDQLVDTVLRHLVRQEVLDEDLSRGFDPTHGDFATPSDVVRIDTGWFPMAPAFEALGRLVHGTEADVRAATRTTLEAHYAFYLRISLTEQAALVEHLIKSEATDKTIEFGRAQEAAREGLGQLVATYLWFSLEDAIVQSIERHFDHDDWQ